MTQENENTAFAGLDAIADRICPNLAPAQDETGSYVRSLTEATMGITAALMEISKSLDRVANAIQDFELKSKPDHDPY